ncbi:unnamed protein product [Allacma fusca]|uniref:Uncharacterized protein n=1 Tax=Allacma fusca TaxID=39272 RepID=A0A8J2NRQ0_9HEXA|nr:unnamed protein product [Allacma fusca]
MEQEQLREEVTELHQTLAVQNSTIQQQIQQVAVLQEQLTLRYPRMPCRGFLRISAVTPQTKLATTEEVILLTEIPDTEAGSILRHFLQLITWDVTDLTRTEVHTIFGYIFYGRFCWSCSSPFHAKEACPVPSDVRVPEDRLRKLRRLQRSKEFREFWNLNKHDLTVIRAKIADLKKAERRRHVSIVDFVERTPANKRCMINEGEDLDRINLDLTHSSKVVPPKKFNTLPEASVRPESKSKAQLESQNKIATLNSRIVALQQNQRRQIDFRQKRREKLLAIKVSEPEVYERLVSAGLPSGTRVRPSLECKQPLLLETIVDLVKISSAADERRRCELLRSCQTLDDLHEALTEKRICPHPNCTLLETIAS